jgi:hypothetical protein
MVRCDATGLGFDGIHPILRTSSQWLRYDATGLGFDGIHPILRTSSQWLRL